MIIATWRGSAPWARIDALMKAKEQELLEV